jgi:hypothetical protein
MREFLIEELKKEVVGPGIKANPGENIPYTDPVSGEEILLKGVHVTNSPTDRYGAGILFPREVTQFKIDKEDNDIVNESNSTNPFSEDNIDLQEMNGDTREDVEENSSELENDCDDDKVSMANQLKPSAMGLTIRCKNSGLLQIDITSARYEKANDTKPKLKYNEQGILTESSYQCEYFIRKPLKIKPITIYLNEITQRGLFKKENLFTYVGENWLELLITNRTSADDLKEGVLILTFTIANIRSGNISQNTLFQNEIKITTSEDYIILPYREKVIQGDMELEMLNLLYRKKKMFGIGHGCAAVWTETNSENNDKSNYDFIKEVKTSVLPEYEIPLISAKDSKSLAMFNLSDCSGADWELGKKSIKNLRDEYLNWIKQLESEIIDWERNNLLKNYIPAAKLNISKCRNNYERINKGVELLTNDNPDENLICCFRWMNHAMLWQQQRSKIAQRKWMKAQDTDDIVLPEFEIISLTEFHNQGNGRWRPFQLAFVLMNIEAIWNEESDDRKILDLIWFPTGGGKTEAYLGLSALQIFARRIKAVTVGRYNYSFYSGTSILMRYTLRLLTVQQYERASSLICACEFIRNENKRKIGNDKISIGLWVGGNSTPNKNKDSGNNNDGAISLYNSLIKDGSKPYEFVVMKCPCCGAQIGKLEENVSTKLSKLKGLQKVGNNNDQRIIFKCENTNCDTNKQNWDELPLYVVDEDIFKKKTTLVIGTVDKFAMLTWKAGRGDATNEYDYLQAGTLFGFRYNHDINTTIGNRVSRILPPQLIIQDELHLIAGPLGTMVGLYETMVQTLCNNYHNTTPPFLPEDKFIPPKIIASSATISRAAEQVKNLYGVAEEYLNIFPPQGIEFGETWFSNIIDTNIKPGRKYIGILAPGYKSIQTAETRVYSRLLQASKKGDFEELEKNYYWTIVGYFNSIRGLGSASTLINSDISQYSKTLINRELTEKGNRRYWPKFMELTSRMSDSEIPRILKRLEEKYTKEDNKALDICLATNMIATGVDVSRLGLMVVHGQPKTTAEYIQASSRVGRDLRNIPNNPQMFAGQGLVITIYSPTKPRDKSHYEQFQSYHSRIYANVEPTSVTPFSVNAREKALHAIFIGLVRQLSHGSLRFKPNEIDSDFHNLAERIKQLILKRCKTVDTIEENNVLSELELLINNWQNNAITDYGDAGNYTTIRKPNTSILMYSASAELSPFIDTTRYFPLKTNTSMRGVDTESNVKIYQN